MKNLSLIFFSLLLTFSLNAQLKHTNKIVNYVVSYLKLDSTKIKNESLVIIPTIGFNRKTNFILKLNSKIISTCIRCQSNESIGFVEGENTKNGVYYFTLSFTKFKLGDLLEFKYNNESIIYKIEKNIYDYSALYISKYDKQWFLSFERFRKGNVE